MRAPERTTRTAGAETAPGPAAAGPLPTSAAAGDAAAAAAAGRPLASLRRYLGRFSLVGLSVGLLFYWISLTPSLLPRSWTFQGAVTGISVVVGYGIGVLGQWVITACGVHIRWPRAVSLVAWWSLAAAAAVVVPVGVVLGVHWQGELREMFGMPPVGSAHGVGIVLVAAAVALIVMQLARGFRWVVRRLAGWIDRLVPRPVSRLVSVLLVTALVLAIVSGGFWAGVRTVLNRSYATANAFIDPAVIHPQAKERSGSPESTQSWESLGAAGRRFVAGGPSVEQLRAFAAESNAGPVAVREPIRVYAGLDAAGDLVATAHRVVAELDRTDAWDRAVLVVATSMDTGSIDPGMAATVEFMHGGDTAIASMQYSYLPSWISFVADRDSPPAAGRALFEAVYARWSHLPVDRRPRLVVFGLSLGSFGAQGAFSGLQDVVARTDGALFVGTPSFTPMSTELSAARDPGSPEIAPVVDGGTTVRWGLQVPGGADLWRSGDDWGPPRVVYLQHASDAVVWWSPTLVWSKPDWLSEPRGVDVSPNVNWFPAVTFWQVTADLFVSAADEIPEGHGHRYGPEYADAWAALWPPRGWSAGDTQRLKSVVAQWLADRDDD